MADLDLARQHGMDRTAYVAVGDGDTGHQAPAGPGGIWPETFCGHPASHGIDDPEGTCARCERAAAAFRGEDETPAVRSRRTVKASGEDADGSGPDPANASASVSGTATPGAPSATAVSGTANTGTPVSAGTSGTGTSTTTP